MTSKRRRRSGIPDETPIIPPEKPDIPDRRKDVYYLICEGHTERDYFGKIASTYADDFRFSIVLSPGTQPEGGFDAETTVDWALRQRDELHHHTTQATVTRKGSVNGRHLGLHVRSTAFDDLGEVTDRLEEEPAG